MKTIKILIQGCLVILFLACGGNADFSGTTGSQNLQPAPHVSVDWQWPCANETDGNIGGQGSMEEIADQSFRLMGPGDYSLSVSKRSGLTLKISGSFCSSQLKRDIVFIIDVSGSMKNNDPYQNGTCGRFEAMKRALKNLADTGAQFSIVTFSDDLATSSNGFFEDEINLFANLAANSLPEEVICANLKSTNYDAGLKRAEELLRKGRKNAAKEIYFISDGEPNPNEDGIFLANKLKSEGIGNEKQKILVNIATIMLKGEDFVLEQYIASRDENDKPLHAKVDDVSQLANALESFAFNEIKGGQISVLGVGGDNAQKFDIKPEKNDPQFAIKSLGFEVSSISQGLEVDYKYWDNKKRTFQNKGTLSWSEVSP